MSKADYLEEVEDDAFEYLRYHAKDVKEAIEDDFEFASFRGGNGCDDISYHVADRDYSLQEAADVLEYCTNEETDSSMWIGKSGIRGMIAACAQCSYTNDVAAQVEEFYDGIRDRYEVRHEVVTEQGAVIESFEDELDAEDYTDEHKDTSVREVSNYVEIWREFISEHVSEPVYVFDGVDHELYRIVEDAGEYSVYRLKDVRVVASGYEFNFEDKPYKTWGNKPFEDADVTDSPAVFFDDVKRWSQHKVRF